MAACANAAPKSAVAATISEGMGALRVRDDERITVVSDKFDWEAERPASTSLTKTELAALCKALKSCKSCPHVELIGCEIQDVSPIVQALHERPKLSVLDLTWSPLSNDAIESMSSCAKTVVKEEFDQPPRVDLALHVRDFRKRVACEADKCCRGLAFSVLLAVTRIEAALLSSKATPVDVRRLSFIHTVMELSEADYEQWCEELPDSLRSICVHVENLREIYAKIISDAESEPGEAPSNAVDQKGARSIAKEVAGKEGLQDGHTALRGERPSERAEAQVKARESGGSPSVQDRTISRGSSSSGSSSATTPLWAPVRSFIRCFVRAALFETLLRCGWFACLCRLERAFAEALVVSKSVAANPSGFKGQVGEMAWGVRDSLTSPFRILMHPQQVAKGAWSAVKNPGRAVKGIVRQAVDRPLYFATKMATGAALGSVFALPPSQAHELAKAAQSASDGARASDSVDAKTAAISAVCDTFLGDRVADIAAAVQRLEESKSEVELVTCLRDEILATKADNRPIPAHLSPTSVRRRVDMAWQGLEASLVDMRVTESAVEDVCSLVQTSLPPWALEIHQALGTRCFLP